MEQPGLEASAALLMLLQSRGLRSDMAPRAKRKYHVKQDKVLGAVPNISHWAERQATPRACSATGWH
eukprot:3613289-Karenia_brevis.AAC.1